VCDCSECGYAFLKHPVGSDKPELDATPNDDLRELVESWQDGYDVYKRATDPSTDIRANVLEQCADELEALLDEEDEHA